MDKASVEQVANYVRNLSIQRFEFKDYADILEKERIDGKVFLALNLDGFNSIGIIDYPRRKLFYDHLIQLKNQFNNQQRQQSYHNLLSQLPPLFITDNRSISHSTNNSNALNHSYSNHNHINNNINNNNCNIKKSHSSTPKISNLPPIAALLPKLKYEKTGPMQLPLFPINHNHINNHQINNNINNSNNNNINHHQSNDFKHNHNHSHNHHNNHNKVNHNINNTKKKSILRPRIKSIHDIENHNNNNNHSSNHNNNHNINNNVNHNNINNNNNNNNMKQPPLKKRKLHHSNNHNIENHNNHNIVDNHINTNITTTTMTTNNIKPKTKATNSKRRHTYRRWTIDEEEKIKEIVSQSNDDKMNWDEFQKNHMSYRTVCGIKQHWEVMLKKDRTLYQKNKKIIRRSLYESDDEESNDDDTNDDENDDSDSDTNSSDGQGLKQEIIRNNDKQINDDNDNDNDKDDDHKNDQNEVNDDDDDDDHSNNNNNNNNNNNDNDKSNSISNIPNDSNMPSLIPDS